MSVILERMNELGKKIEKGTASIEETKEFTYLTCQQMIISLGVKGTKGLVELPHSQVLACVDAMATLLFIGEWKSKPSLIELEASLGDVEEAKLVEKGEKND
jgi:hypothetical protein